MLTSEAPPTPSSEEEQQKVNNQPGPDVHELHFLLGELEDDRNRTRWREAVWISIIIHMLVVMTILLAPKIFPNSNNVVLLSQADQLKNRDMTFLDMPPDLQKHVPTPKTDILSDKNRIATSRQPLPDRRLLQKLLDARRAGAPAPKAQQAPPAQSASAAPQQAPQQAQQQATPPQQKPDPALSARLEPPKPNPNPDVFRSAMSAGSAIQQAARATAAARTTGGGGDYGINQPRSNSAVQSAMDILSDTMGVDFGPYLQRVLHDVRINWYNLIPEEARPPLLKKGKVSIEFAIAKNGSVMGLKISGPSGDVSLDRAALGGITASNPFPPLPAEFRGEYLALRFRFYYNPESNDLR